MPAPPETSETESQPRSPVVTPIRVVIGLCLFVPFVALLWVSSYARTEPTFIGLPFFYWYQMMWVPLSAAMTMLAYKLVKRDTARRRARGEDGAE
jgi:membrane protein implicated in regulation of membrane protease activity